MNSTLNSQPPMGEPVREVLHGIEVEDPFRWLEDQDSLATRSFIEAEQRIYREYLDHHHLLRSKIERRVSEMLTGVNVDLPLSDRRGGLVYLKREADAEQRGIYCRDQTGVERLLISVEMLGRDFFVSLAIIQISPDGHYLVFGIRIGGEDAQEVGIYDLVKRQLLPDRLPCGFFRGLVFESDGRGFYYVQEERLGRYQLRRSVRRHGFGDDQLNDLEIYHAGEGPATRLILQGAEDASGLGYLVVSLESVLRTRFLIHEFPLSKQPQVVARLSGASFGPRFWASRIEASTTLAAPHGRIVRIDLKHPEERSWSNIIPEASESIGSWERYEESRVIHYAAGCRRLTRIYSVSGKHIRTIEYPGAGTFTLGQVDSISRCLFYSHSDVTKPPAIYAVDLITGRHHLWWQQQTSIRQEALEVESRAYTSKDGTAIPITLIHPRNAQGVRPTLLSAYGGGGVSATPKFSVLFAILIETGFTCATAHVRGGGEGGLEWHLAAQKQRKQVTVDDLLGAAEWLIEIGLSTQSHLGLAGQSNGALMTLCALTQAPHLFRAAVALGPIADLTRFHLFGVARGSIPELGSPSNPDEFAALYRLSPYHRSRLRQFTLQFSSFLVTAINGAIHSTLAK